LGKIFSKKHKLKIHVSNFRTDKTPFADSITATINDDRELLGNKAKD